MAAREDVVKVTFEVDDKPLEKVNSSIDKIVQNTQKMAGSGGVGKMTQGFSSLADSAKKIASTDIAGNITRGIEEFNAEASVAKDKITSFVNAVKGVAAHPIKTLDNALLSVQMSAGRSAAEFKRLASAKISGLKSDLTNIKNALTQGQSGISGFATALKNIGKVSINGAVNGVRNLASSLKGKAVSAAQGLKANLGSIAKVALDKAVSGVKKLGSGLTSALKTAGQLSVKLGGMALKGLATGVAAGATALGALGAAAIKGYAEYEQLVGGVETLFKGNSKDVVKYANDAYKTAGLSANAYMETVTSFSASLLQSVGGDTAKAAKLADQAVIDMSDNANKMGTDMASIQNAYQGFAKQNYTMLDNLKLGYGGTKEEMQRLLTDAEKITGKKFDLSSYADIVEAIHAVQTEMGITGTTSKEASSTIQGSFNSMKAAWSNFLTGMADPNQDFDQLVGNLIDSVVTFGDNLIPRIQALAPRLVQGIAQIAQAIVPAIPGLLNSLLPVLVQGALSLLSSLVSTMQANAGQLTSTAVSLFMQFVSGFLQMLPQLLSIGGQILLQLIIGITQQLPSLIQMAVNTIITLANGFIQNLPTILQAGIQLLLTLALGIINAIPQLIALVPQVFFAFIDAIMGINWLDVGLQLISAIFSGVWQGIKSLGGGIIDGLKGLFSGGGSEAGAQTVTNLASGIDNTSPVAVSAVTSMNSQVNAAAGDGVSNLVSSTSTGLEGLTTAYNTSYTDVQTSTTTAMNGVKNTIETTDLYSSGVAVMQGLNKGMQSMIPTLAATARKAAATIKSSTDSALDIHSPSRVMEESGMYAGLGQIQGLRKTIPEMQIAAREVSTASIPYDSYDPGSGIYYGGDSSSYTTVSPQFNLSISGTQDDRAMARRVKRYVAEAIRETFESMERKSHSLREA